MNEETQPDKGYKFQMHNRYAPTPAVGEGSSPTQRVSNSEDLLFSERTLEREFRYSIRKMIGKELQWLDNVRIKAYKDHIIGEMVVQLDRYVWAEHIGEGEGHVEFHYRKPSSWWQMFKRDVLPWWVSKRWPVKHEQYHVVRTVPLKVYAQYPDFVPPNNNLGMERVRIAEKLVVRDLYEWRE